jgi:hypothetical protein
MGRRKDFQPIPLARILPEIPGAATEQIGDIVVGKSVLPVEALTVWEPNKTVIAMLNALNTWGDVAAGNRRYLLKSMNDNSTYVDKPLTHGRAVSAYFTLDPAKQSLVLEWGTIDTDGNAKLHTHLNEALNLRERTLNGMTLSSGHIARTPSGIHIALIDSLRPDSFIGKHTPIGKAINTLYANNFVPLDSGGNVQLPAF